MPFLRRLRHNTMTICPAFATGTVVHKTDLTEFLQQGRQTPAIIYHYLNGTGSCPKLGQYRGDITELIH
jgi:hypothetical protein